MWAAVQAIRPFLPSGRDRLAAAPCCTPGRVMEAPDFLKDCNDLVEKSPRVDNALGRSDAMSTNHNHQLKRRVP